MKKSPMHSTRAVRKKPARQQGFLGDYVGNVKAVVDMAGYVKAVCKDWFINGTTFALQAFARPVSFTNKSPDCLGRATCSCGWLLVACRGRAVTSVRVMLLCLRKVKGKTEVFDGVGYVLNKHGRLP